MVSGNLFPAQRPTVVDRPLIAYAFLAQATHVEGDLLSGLVPIFKPIVRERAGRDFDSKEFSTAVSKLYGIKINPWAVDDLAPRLEKAGLVSRHAVTSDITRYVYNNVDDVGDPVSEAQIKLIVRRFVEFATPLLSANGLQLDNAKIEKAFFDQLVNLDFHAILIKPHKILEKEKGEKTLTLPKSEGTDDIQKEISEKAKLDVLCSAFILDVYHNDRPLYDVIVKVATGALLAEVVMNVQDPGKTVSLLTLRIIVDAPFLMSYLNLSGVDSCNYARELVRILLDNGAVIEVFRHSVDELRENLKAVRLGVKAGTGFGPTARRLREPVFAAYVDSVMLATDDLLKRHKIRIIDVPNVQSSYQYFSEEDERAFNRALGFFQNPLAQARDAHSITGTMRLRKGTTARMSSIYKSQYLFVTENPYIVEVAKNFAVERRMIRNDEVPPAVTDRYLAGLMWVLFGGKADEITQYQLLANCTAALEARSDVQAKMVHFLSEMDETMAAQFRAIMTVERGGQHLMQLTLGDPLLIKTTDDAEKILGQLTAKFEEKHIREKEEAIELERKNNEQAIRALHTEHEKVVSAAERARIEAEKQALATMDAVEKSRRLAEERALAATTEAFKEQLAKENAEKELSEIREEMQRQILLNQRDETSKLQMCADLAFRHGKRLHFYFVLLFGVISAGVVYIGTDSFPFMGAMGPIVSALLAGGVMALGFWFVPDKYLEPIIYREMTRVYWRLVNTRLLTDIASRYEQDLRIPLIKVKVNSALMIESERKGG